MLIGLEQQVEALIFASTQSISVDEIHQLIQMVRSEEVIELIDIESVLKAIEKKYANPIFSISLQYLNGGYQLLTKSEFYPLINQLQFHRSKKKLSQAALETLSIIAYRQPITKLEIEQIRGVNCDYSIQRLLEKDLITIIGKSKSIGRPLLYGISTYFMDYFGLSSSTDLPKLNDLLSEENTVGDRKD